MKNDEKWKAKMNAALDDAEDQYEILDEMHCKLKDDYCKLSSERDALAREGEELRAAIEEAVRNYRYGDDVRPIIDKLEAAITKAKPPASVGKE